MIKYRAMKLNSNFQGALLIKWLIHSKVGTRLKILAIGLQDLYVSTILRAFITFELLWPLCS